ncbi:MAG: nuclear transport factor 2 family protein, partial [Planctomycetota bacterium]
AAVGLCGCSTTNSSSNAQEPGTSDSKAVVEELMQAFFRDYDEATMRRLLTEDYIQHNPYVPTGIEPVIGVLPALREAEFDYDTHRIIQDGPWILTHTTYTNAQIFGAETVVAFDIWRVEDGRVAEHWDCITPLVTETVSGRSQTDGPTAVTDLASTEANKRLVEDFVTTFLINEDWSNIDDFIADGRYLQHNPMVDDGPEALKGAIEFLKMKKIHRVIGEGNFVLTQSEAEWDGKPYAFYDLFRVENGKIVEHWDVLQEIPAEMAHDNGMF